MTNQHDDGYFDPSQEYDGNDNGLTKTGLVTQGVHLAIACRLEYGMSKSSKYPRVEIAFEVIGPNDPDTGNIVPFQYYSLKKEARWKFGQFCKAVDPECPPFNAANPDELGEMWGKPLAIKVQHYQDRNPNTGQYVKRERVIRHRAINERELAYLRAAYGDSLVPEAGTSGDAIGVDDDTSFNYGNNVDDMDDAVGIGDSDMPF